MPRLVVFEPGIALIAGARVPVSDAGARGEIQIGGAHGMIVRPLLYGERSRIVIRTAGSPHAIASVSAAVLRAALVQEGDTDRLIAEILALALAGAESNAPPFTATALTVARAGGWDIHQINDAEASEIDRLAIYLGGANDTAVDDGWSRIVFVDDPRSASLEDVRRDLAERLIARAEVAPAPGAPADADAGELGRPIAPFESARHTGELNLVPAHVEQGGAWSFALDPVPDLDAQPHGPQATFGAASPKPEARSNGAKMAAPSVPNLEKLGLGDRAARNRPARPGPAPEHAVGGAPALDRRPINRVSYQPTAPAARLGHGQPTAAAQALGVRGDARPIGPAHPLAEPRATNAILLPPAAATLEPAALPPIDFTPAAQRDDHPTNTAPPPTLAQLEQLADEVADALAALLDQEADLRGAER